MASTTELVFFVNGKKKVAVNPDPEMTCLEYLRSHLRLTGSKLGCGEGGCGACTVMVSTCPAGSDTPRHYSANACLLPLCSLHGMAVTTVEGIGSIHTRLHPVQERLAAGHGSQCGFCTPGFVMSMYSLLRNHPQPTDEQLNNAFDGNLCRCTGYRPILDAYRPFTKGGVCGLGDKCCRNNNGPVTNGDAHSAANNVNGVAENGDSGYDPSQEPIFPPFLKLEGAKLHEQSLAFVGARARWYRPVSLPELLDIKRQHPDCKILIGNTEIGLEVRLKHQHYPVLVSATHVPELTTVQLTSAGLLVGASVTLTTLDNAFKDSIKDLPEQQTRVFAGFVEMLRWFSGHQVRNVGSIGGNIMTCSPISDLNPLLMACGATLTLISTDGGRREVKMDGSFFTGYRKNVVQPNEVLLHVLIPFSNQNEWFHSYKQANRKEDDISIVNAGMRVVLDDNAKVLDLTLAFGGMAPTTVMATNTMKQLLGLPWNEDLLTKACDLLTSDLPLEPGAPGGDIAYRRSLTVSFFFKFYLSVLRQIQQQGVEVSSRIKSSERAATELLERGPVSGVQWFEVSPLADNPASALRQPVVHESAYKQASGEAIYFDDITPVQGELHMAFVLSTKSRARLVKVDPSPALAMPGVVDFISRPDIPASNNYNLAKDDLIFADGEVLYQGQPIGAILADTHRHALIAARAVLVQYDVMEPVITIKEAIAKKSFYDEDRMVSSGDVTEALSRADNVLEGEVHVEAQEHFYLEPQGAIAYPLEDGGVDVVSATHDIHGTQMSIASTLGIHMNKVKVRTRRLGGAFGGKEVRSMMISLPCAVASVKHRRAVRCVLERQDDMMMTGTRHPFLGKYKIGFTSKGQITAYDVQYYLNAGYSLDLSDAVSKKALLETDASYKIENIRARSKVCKTNLPSNTAFRGFGYPQALAILETAITHVANHLDMAPHKLRELNMYKEGDVTSYNTELTQCNLRRCWDDVKEQSKFLQRRKEVDLFNSENRWRKRGLAVTSVKYGLSYYDSFLNQGSALVNVYTDGTVLLNYGGVEMGQGLHTKMLQVASQTLGVPLSKLQVDESASSVVPNASPTAASVSSDLCGQAVMNACTTLMERLKPARKMVPEDATWEQLVEAAYFQGVHLSAVGHYLRPDIGYSFETREGRPHAYFTYGSACSMVEVDCLTGDHQVLTTDIVMDVGQSLNPAIDIGQIEGGFIQGYGMLMLEQYKVQADGTLLTRGPSNYKIPSVGNIPQQFNVTLLRESGNPTAIYSSKGVGEPPLLLANSVLCAVHDAVSAARRDEGLNPFTVLNTPVTPARIRMACSDKFTGMYEELERKSDKTAWFVDL